MKPRAIFELLRDAFKDWGEDKAARLGAALAYYTIFSIGPLLVLIIAIAGKVFGEEAARGQIVGTIGSVVGSDAAAFIQEMVKTAGEPASSTIAGIVGTVTLLLGAAGFFGQLKDALNTIWEVQPKPGLGIMGFVKRNLLTFAMVAASGFLLLVSLVINAALAALGDFLEARLLVNAFVWQVVNYAATFGVITLVFAMIYKVLPDVKIPWRNVWVGALITAMLFVLGQVALGFYFGLSNPGTAFGAAGSLVVVLVWIYYSAQILFFGAEVTQVYSYRYGAPVRPDEHAEWVSQEMLAKQGIKTSKVARHGLPEQAAAGAGKSPWFKHLGAVETS
jgi:membrane protein